MTNVNRFIALLFFLPLSFACFAQKKASNIALVLPFCSQKIIDNPDCYDAQLGNMCREYYQGALIALDSFERAKIALRINIFDTENDSLNTLRILQKPQLKDAELIIGPVLQGGNKMMSAFAKEKSVYHVSPLMTFSKTRLEDAYWISANPDLPTYAAFLYNYISIQTHDSANVILVSDKSSLDKNISTVIRQVVSAPGKMMKLRLLEYEKSADIIKYLSPTLSNHIIIPSSNEASVNALLRKVKDTTDRFNISCYGFSQWLDFKNTDFETWQLLNVHIVTPYFVDYDNEQVKQFILAYRDRFHTEPSEAAFKGYDQVLLFGMALAMNGKGFINQLENKTVPALHTQFNFKRQQGGSHQNYYLNVIRLENLRMRRVN